MLRTLALEEEQACQKQLQNIQVGSYQIDNMGTKLLGGWVGYPSICGIKDTSLCVKK